MQNSLGAQKLGEVTPIASIEWLRVRLH